MHKRGRLIFGIIGYGLIGLCFLSLLLRAVWHVKSGQDFGYVNYKNQPMTYLGLLGSVAIAAIVGLIGLFYRLRKKFESRRMRPS